MSQISRRDFLKIASAIAGGTLVSEKLPSLQLEDKEHPNIIIILCDAFSARHLSLYGYPRLTTPNIDAFAQYSTVFHNHYSGGNYTTTGTASMLTGMIPWKHRAINYGGLVRSEYVHVNPYTLLGSDYHRFAFSQNPWPDRLMGQYYKDIDRFLHPSSYSLMEANPLLRMFENDRALASIAMDDFLLPAQNNSIAGSPVFGYLNKSHVLNIANNQKRVRYPKGFPEIMDPGYLIPYLNEDIYSGVYSELSQLESENSPYFAYFHLYSPHFPYKPRNDYRTLFRDDGYKPVSKPVHPLSAGLHEDFMLGQRDLYDRQIAQIDEEFGKLILRLNESGILENSYLIFTADHGELFERGFVGHGFHLMYEPVLRIPLIIRAPGQTKREDIHALTSNIDILPTLLSIAGKNKVSEIDGSILPGFGGEINEDRPVFSVVAVDNSAFAPLKKAVISMRKRSYKLIAYLGYDNVEQVFELYDLENDPDELINLATKDSNTLSAMKAELFAYLDETNRPFMKKY
ncbi:MAG: sulfatase-like hydrolase/transferase [Anaerolineales bacterium]|nr:sulfatase-like hydrolase/transferase [Anaerolineales bacterium]